MNACAVPTVKQNEAEARRRFLEPGDPDVSTAICPTDGMFKPDGQKHYFAVGRSGLECARWALSDAGRPDPESILDLPCGHGRVLRFLAAAYPKARLTACDLLRDGVDFCADTFSARPVYSQVDPKAIQIPERFDLIWCGSLMTHFDAPQWVEFMHLFARLLKPGGVCAFTSHGDYVGLCMRDYNWAYGVPDQVGLLADWAATGFGYRGYADQPGYGISLAATAWIKGVVAGVPGLRWVSRRPRAWDKHHDLIVVQRKPRPFWMRWLP